MSLRKLSLRVWINSAILLMGALAAHAAACGTFIAIIPFIIISSLVFLAIVILSAQEIEGPKLAALIVLLQFTSHILLGGMNMNTTTMLLSHVIAGMLSYLFITENELLWKAAITFPGMLLLFISIPMECAMRTGTTQNFLRIYSQKKRRDIFLIAAHSRIPAPPFYITR